MKKGNTFRCSMNCAGALNTSPSTHRGERRNVLHLSTGNNNINMCRYITSTLFYGFQTFEVCYRKHHKRTGLKISRDEKIVYQSLQKH